jgi:hypothetical protein
MLYHLDHTAYREMENLYHIEMVATEGQNGTLASIDFLGLVIIIVTALLHKQICKLVRQAPLLCSYK